MLEAYGTLLANHSLRNNLFLALEFLFVNLWCLVGTLLT